jgi:hypothetical protein
MRKIQKLIKTNSRKEKYNRKKKKEKNKRKTIELFRLQYELRSLVAQALDHLMS